MDKESLIAKRNAIEVSFNEQTKIRSSAELEQIKLQGEHRLVSELIDNLDKEESDKE